MKTNLINVAFDNYLAERMKDPEFKKYVDSLGYAYTGFYNLTYTFFRAGYIRALENTKENK